MSAVHEMVGRQGWAESRKSGQSEDHIVEPGQAYPRVLAMSVTDAIPLRRTSTDLPALDGFESGTTVVLRVPVR
jgi:hypothetical protein